MTITLVGLSAHGADEIKAFFEIGDGEHRQQESFVIATKDCADLRLSVGNCTPEMYDAVAYAASLYGARRRGLFLLSYGRCSERALAKKLCAKGIDREIATEAAAALAQEGYLDDCADALCEAERAFSKLWGKRRIVAALREKGYGDEAVKSALASLEENGADFKRNCATFLKRKYPELPEDPKEKQKLFAACSRMGYTADEIRGACRLLYRT